MHAYYKIAIAALTQLLFWFTIIPVVPNWYNIKP